MARLNLHEAVWSGNTEAVQNFIAQGVNVNAKIDDFHTLLHVSSITCNLKMAKLLIEAGARDSINARDHEGNTPLSLTIANNGDAEFVKFLIDSGANVHVLNDQGFSVFYWTLCRPRLREKKSIGESSVLFTDVDGEILNILSNASVRVSDQEANEIISQIEGLEESIPRFGSIEDLKMLIYSGADPEVLKKIEESLTNPLRSMLEWKNGEILALLLKTSAKNDVKGDEGLTILQRAMYKWDLDVIKLFIDAGGDVNSPNCVGDTPLYWSIAQNDISMCEYLLVRGADVNVKNLQQFTPLHWAIILNDSSSHLEIINFLLTNGAKVNEKDDRGMTPLHWGVVKKNEDTLVVETLLEAGADVSVKDNQDWTALETTLGMERLDIAEILIHNGADVNGRGSGKSALLLAVKKNDAETIRRLISRYGADVNVKDRQNLTPLHWAFKYNNNDSHLGVIKVLLKKGADRAAKDAKGMTPINYFDWKLESDNVKTFEYIFLNTSTNRDDSSSEQEGNSVNGQKACDDNRATETTGRDERTRRFREFIRNTVMIIGDYSTVITLLVFFVVSLIITLHSER